MFANFLRTSNEVYAEFSVIHDSVRITPVFATFRDITFQYCISSCMVYNGCQSVNVKVDLSMCELSEKQRSNGKMVHDKGWIHVETNPYSLYQGRTCENLKPCIDYDYCVATSFPPWYACKCKNSTNGKACNSNPCQNKGKCIHNCAHANYTCQCFSPYFGKNCENQFIHFETQHIDHKIYAIPLINKDSLTACIWFNSETFTSYAQALFAIFPVDQRECNTFLGLILDRMFWLEIRGNRYIFSYIFEEFKWYHICISWKQLFNVTLYVNGKSEEIQQSGSSNTPLNAAYIVLGQETDYKGTSCQVNDIRNGFLGKVAMLNIWGNELSVSDVQNVYTGKYIEGDIVNWDMFT